jgi:hypothetical protein
MKAKRGATLLKVREKLPNGVGTKSGRFEIQRPRLMRLLQKQRSKKQPLLFHTLYSFLRLIRNLEGSV